MGQIKRFFHSDSIRETGLLNKMAINNPQVKKVVKKVGGAYGRDST